MRHSSRDSIVCILPDRFETVEGVDIEDVSGYFFFISKSAKACLTSREVLSCFEIAMIGKMSVTSSMTTKPGTNLDFQSASDLSLQGNCSSLTTWQEQTTY